MRYFLRTLAHEMKPKGRTCVSGPPNELQDAEQPGTVTNRKRKGLMIVYFISFGRATPLEAPSLKLLYASSHSAQYKLFTIRISANSLHDVITHQQSPPEQGLRAHLVDFLQYR